VLSCGFAAIGSLLPMRAFSYVSMISSFAALVTGVAVIAACATNLFNTLGSMDAVAVHGGGLAELVGPILAETASHASNFPRSLGIIIFCFAGHPCFPIMHECLREKKDWGRTINIAFILSLMYYSGLGCTGSLAFGHATKPSIIQNMKDLPEPSAQLWRGLAAVAIMIKVQLTAPLLLNTILVAVFPPAPVKRKSVEGAALDNLKRTPALILLCALTGTVALAFADNVAALASLTGSLLVMVTSVVFPILVFRKLARSQGEQQQRKERLTHGLILALAGMMALAGTIQAANDLRGTS